MADTVKFTDDEMKSLQQLQDTYSQLTTRMGQLGAQKIVAEQTMESIDNEEASLREQWEGNQKAEREMVDTLNKKYGPGQLDPQTGEFTPQVTEDTAETTED